MAHRLTKFLMLMDQAQPLHFKGGTLVSAFAGTRTEHYANCLGLYNTQERFVMDTPELSQTEKSQNPWFLSRSGNMCMLTLYLNGPPRRQLYALSGLGLQGHF